MTDHPHIRVMIVEDEPSFQDLVRLVLSLDPQFEIVLSAGTGEEAVEGLADARPDLVLVDFRLPGIDGLEEARRIKDQRPDTKIAIVTAHSDQVLTRLAREADIEQLIPKARFSLDRVREMVDRA